MNRVEINKELTMPAICRGSAVDEDICHCSVPRRLAESPDVFVNHLSGGSGISRQGDVNTPHLLPPAPCPTHQAPITTGSPTVFINGMGCGRIGDAVTACTVVATGSPNTFAGPGTISGTMPQDTGGPFCLLTVSYTHLTLPTILLV